MDDALLWAVHEITLVSDRDRDNPYLDVDTSAVFTGPGGAVVRRAAFWDGGRTWRVRFAPPMPGHWTFRTSSSDQADAGLHGVTGGLIASSAGDHAGPVQTHGFLRVSDDRTHLAHLDGTPFFWLGDTHWRFAWERWDDANKPGWTSQFRGMVDRRVAQGFSVYQTNIMSFGRGWDTAGCWGDGAPFRELIPEFFSDVLDPRMAYIAEKGLVNAVGLGWYQSSDIDPAGLVRFARYIVARYGAAPMVWTLGGEVAGYDDVDRDRRISAWRDVALAIREEDDYSHPITAHLTNERPIASYYQDEDWLSFTLNQLGHGDLDMSPDAYQQHLARFPHRPMVEGESMYEGITTVETVARREATPLIVRQVAYRAMQSGCCGYTYGAQGCWNNAWDYGIGATIWGDLPWYEGIDLEGANQLSHLRDFYTSMDWWTLRPSGDVFHTTSGENERFYPPAVSADADRRLVVAYFGETHRNTGEPSFVGLADTSFRLRWFDPRTGEWALVGTRRPVGGRLELPLQPDELHDWLLVADAEH